MSTVPSGKVLLDTNIVSYLMRGGELAQRYRPHSENKLAAISFTTWVNCNTRPRSKAPCL